MGYVDYFAGIVPKWASEAARTTASAPAPVEREQREHPRRPLEKHAVAVVCSFGVLPAEMLDLSLTGAKVKILSGLAPNAGEEITIRLADGVERHGAIAWISDRTLGISLQRPLPRALD